MEPSRARTRAVVDRLGLPYPGYLGTLVRRSAVVWLLVRGTYAALLLVGMVVSGGPVAAEGVADVLHPGWPTRVALAGVAALLVAWDCAQARERLLNDNLGTAPGWLRTAPLLVALALDAATQALLRRL